MRLWFKKFNFCLLIAALFFAFYKEANGKEQCQETNNSPLDLDADCIVLNLTNAVSRALNANRQMLATIENLTSAQYGIDLAANEFNISITPNSQAGYIGRERNNPGWNIGGGLDFEKKFTNGTVVSFEPSIIKTEEHYLTGIDARFTQPFMRGLGREYQLSNLLGAQYNLRKAYRNLYTAQVKLMLRTIQNLYEIIKGEKSLELNQESHQRISQFYQAAQLKEKIGLSDAMDVYRAETELRQAEDALKATVERLEDSKDQLRDLLALPLDVCIKVEVPIIFTANPVTLDRALELALKNRIELDQGKDEKRENVRLSNVAKEKLYPEVNLVLNYSNKGRDKYFTTSCRRGRENTWGVGVTTSADFNPVGEQVAYEQSKMAISSASRGIEQSEANIILEVKKGVRQLERAYERIQLQEDQIKTAQGELFLAKIKFDRGMADNFNVIQAEKSLRAAQQNYWNAVIDHITGEFQLLVAMGLLIDKPTIR